MDNRLENNRRLAQEQASNVDNRLENNRRLLHE